MDKFELYVGNGRKVEGYTTKGEKYEFISLGLNRKDLDKLYSYLNEKGWVNLSLNKTRTQYEDSPTKYSMKINIPKKPIIEQPLEGQTATAQDIIDEFDKPVDNDGEFF